MTNNTKAGFLLRQTQPNGATITIENPDVDMDAGSFITMMRDFAIACGYSAETIDKYLED